MAGAVADFLKRSRRNLDRPLTEGTVIGERVRASSAFSQISFLPYIDSYTGETETIRAAYREMLKSDVVKAALLGKIYAVASLDLQMHPANDENPRDQEIAEFCRYAYTQALGHVEVDTEANRVHAATEGGFASLCETILLPGLIDKFSVSNKVWYRDVWGRGRWAGKRFYRGLKAKDGCQLEQDEFRNITGVVSRRWGGTAPGANGSVVNRSTVYGGTVAGGLGAPIEDPRDFVIFRNLPMFEGSGMSDLRAAYGPYWRLDTVEKIRVIHLEKFTSPHMIGKYKAGKDQAETDANRDELLAEILLAKSRNGTVIPEGVELECVALATRGEKEFEDACRSYREAIALAIAGAFLQMLTAQGGGGEMRGDAGVQRSTAELFVWRLAATMTAIIDRQLTPDLVDHNFAGADYPTCTLGGINYAELKSGIELDEIAQRMGAKLSRKAFAKKYALQLADPADPGDTLTAAPTGFQAGGFGGGIGGFGGGLPGGNSGLPASPIDPAATAAPSTSTQDAASTGDIQATALNGAQIASLLEITGQISSGQMSADAARTIILAAFPLMNPQTITNIVTKIKAVPAAIPQPAAFAEQSQAADDRYSQLRAKYGDESARAVMQATAALLGGVGAGHAFTEPPHREQPQAQPQTINVNPPAVTVNNQPQPQPVTVTVERGDAPAQQSAQAPAGMKRQVFYDADGRVSYTIDTPLPPADANSGG